MKIIQALFLVSLFYTNIIAQTSKQLLPSADVIFDNVDLWRKKGDVNFGELISSRNAITKLKVFSVNDGINTYIDIESSLFSAKSAALVRNVKEVINEDDKTQKGYLAYCTDVYSKEGKQKIFFLVYQYDKLIIISYTDTDDITTLKFYNK